MLSCFPFDLSLDLRDKLIRRHNSQIAALTVSDGHGVRLRFPGADDEHVGDLLNGGVADLVADLFTSKIAVHPYPLVREFFLNPPSVVGLFVGHRQYPHLNRGEPQRKQAAVVLYQNRKEPLDRAQ